MNGGGVIPRQGRFLQDDASFFIILGTNFNALASDLSAEDFCAYARNALRCVTKNRNNPRRCAADVALTTVLRGFTNNEVSYTVFDFVGCVEDISRTCERSLELIGVAAETGGFEEYTQSVRNHVDCVAREVKSCCEAFPPASIGDIAEDLVRRIIFGRLDCEQAECLCNPGNAACTYEVYRFFNSCCAVPGSDFQRLNGCDDTEADETQRCSTTGSQRDTSGVASIGRLCSTAALNLVPRACDPQALVFEETKDIERNNCGSVLFDPLDGPSIPQCRAQGLEVVENLNNAVIGDGTKCVGWEGVFQNYFGVKFGGTAIRSPLVFTCDLESDRAVWATNIANVFCNNLLTSARSSGPDDTTCHECYKSCCVGIADGVGIRGEGRDLILEVCNGLIDFGFRKSVALFPARTELQLTIVPDDPQIV
jgi:hypothetical protein